jgi:hypothetical protein
LLFLHLCILQMVNSRTQLARFLVGEFLRNKNFSKESSIVLSTTD